MALQRDQAKLEGEHGQLGADIARARGRISEIELQIIQIDKDFSTEVLKELREIEGRIAELKERMIAAVDQLRRIDIRSPESGTVHQLTVHTVGGVIGAGETIMLIVPRQDQLVVEARVAPVDIDQIVKGAPVQVRIMAGNQRTTPSVSGVVTHISADLTRETATGGQPGQAYFLTRVSHQRRLIEDPRRAQAGAGHAGRSPDRNRRAHAARIPAEAIAGADRADVPRTIDPDRPQPEAGSRPRTSPSAHALRWSIRSRRSPHQRVQYSIKSMA